MVILIYHFENNTNVAFFFIAKLQVFGRQRCLDIVDLKDDENPHICVGLIVGNSFFHVLGIYI
jgi:hypothetical protein